MAINILYLQKSVNLQNTFCQKNNKFLQILAGHRGAWRAEVRVSVTLKVE